MPFTKFKEVSKGGVLLNILIHVKRGASCAVIEAYRLLLYLLQVVFVPGLFTADTIHLTVAPSGGDDLSVSSLSSVL